MPVSVSLNKCWYKKDELNSQFEDELSRLIYLMIINFSSRTIQLSHN